MRIQDIDILRKVYNDVTEAFHGAGMDTRFKHLVNATKTLREATYGSPGEFVDIADRIGVVSRELMKPHDCVDEHDTIIFTGLLMRLEFFAREHGVMDEMLGCRAKDLDAAPRPATPDWVEDAVAHPRKEPKRDADAVDAMLESLGRR